MNLKSASALFTCVAVFSHYTRKHIFVERSLFAYCFVQFWSLEGMPCRCVVPIEMVALLFCFYLYKETQMGTGTREETTELVLVSNFAVRNPTAIQLHILLPQELKTELQWFVKDVRFWTVLSVLYWRRFFKTDLVNIRVHFRLKFYKNRWTTSNLNVTLLFDPLLDMDRYRIFHWILCFT